MKSNPLSLAALLISLLAVALAASTLRFDFQQVAPETDQSGSETPEDESPRIAAPTLASPNAANQLGSSKPSSDLGIGIAPTAQAPTILLPTQSAPATKEELEADAKFAVEHLLRLLPDDAMALHVSAMLNSQLHNTQEAVKLWSKCIELDPQREHYYINLAAAALDRGDGPLALTTLEQAITRGLKSPDIFHHKCLALLNTGSVTEAAALAGEILQKHPEATSLQLVLGQAQLKLGELEAAETNLKEAVDKGVASRAAFFSLLNVSLRLGKKEEAAKYREAYESFAKQGNEAQQYSDLSEAEARRVCVTVLMECIHLYKGAKRPNDAEHLLLRVLAIDPDNRAAVTELAKLYEREKRFANELLARERLIDLERTNLMNFLFAARAAALSGEIAKAESLIKLAISMAPRTPTGYAAMAEFLIEQGQHEKSIWYLQQALELAPTPDGCKLLSQTLRKLGREREAQEADETRQKLSN